MLVFYFRKFCADWGFSCDNYWFKSSLVDVMNFVKDRKESPSADIYVQSWLNKLIGVRLLGSRRCLVTSYYTFFVLLDNVGR